MKTSPEIQELAQTTWQPLAEAKWKEFREAEGHFLSIHSPQWTMQIDLKRRRSVRVKLMAWTVKWFAERGHTIVCVPNEKDTDTFSLQMADAPTMPVTTEPALSVAEKIEIQLELYKERNRWVKAQKVILNKEDYEELHEEARRNGVNAMPYPDKETQRLEYKNMRVYCHEKHTIIFE